MSNELVTQDPNRQKIEPTKSSSGEFAKPDKTRQANTAILEPKQLPDKNNPAPLRSAVGYRDASGISAQRPHAGLRKTRQANAVNLGPKQLPDKNNPAPLSGKLRDKYVPSPYGDAPRFAGAL